MAEQIKVNVNPGGYVTVPATAIVLGERCRKDFGDIAGLAESIRRFGLNHPLVVAPLGDGRYRLCSGGRRYRALVMELQVDEIPVVIRSDYTELEQKEWELEENLRRLNQPWTEQAVGLAQLEAIKRKMHQGEWTHEDTARVVNTSRSDVVRMVKMGRLLQEQPELKEQLGKLPISAAIKRVERIEEAKRLAKEVSSVQAFLRKGDSKELIKSIDNESVGLVLTDPPFGIAQLESNRGSGGNVQTTLVRDEDNLELEELAALYHWLLPEMSRVLVPGGHFYVFCCQQNWDLLRRQVVKAGLELQEYPVIWWKGRTTAPGRGYLYMPCTELILFGWKPPRKRMLDKNMPALVECAPVINGIHPFQKPVELMKTFITQSTIVGEVVLDPFAGSASTIVAATLLGRTGIGFDLDSDGSVFPLAERRVKEALEEVKRRQGMASATKMGAEKPLEQAVRKMLAALLATARAGATPEALTAQRLATEEIKREYNLNDAALANLQIEVMVMARRMGVDKELVEGGGGDSK